MLGTQICSSMLISINMAALSYAFYRRISGLPDVRDMGEKQISCIALFEKLLYLCQ